MLQTTTATTSKTSSSMILALKIAVISFVFTEILTSDRMIFNFMRSLPYFFTCPYCIAGQLALWSYLFPCGWIEFLFTLSLPIAFIHVILIANERCQKNSRDSNVNDKAEALQGGGAIPVEPEEKISE